MNLTRPASHDVAEVVQGSLSGSAAKTGLPQRGHGRCVKFRLR
jgi:hypothetical protein